MNVDEACAKDWEWTKDVLETAGLLPKEESAIAQWKEVYTFGFVNGIEYAMRRITHVVSPKSD